MIGMRPSNGVPRRAQFHWQARIGVAFVISLMFHSILILLPLNQHKNNPENYPVSINLQLINRNLAGVVGEAKPINSLPNEAFIPDQSVPTQAE